MLKYVLSLRWGTDSLPRMCGESYLKRIRLPVTMPAAAGQTKTPRHRFNDEGGDTRHEQQREVESTVHVVGLRPRSQNERNESGNIMNRKLVSPNKSAL
jgi:hypothetical protein